MLKINRTLIQLNNAIKLANSPLPQEKALSVVLFDQLIEITLYGIGNLPLPIKSQGKSDGKIRKPVLQHFDQLLKFAKDEGYINETDKALLAFTHSIRNAIYHEANDSTDKVAIALSIYRHFILTHKETFLDRNSLTAIATGIGYEQIDFGQGLKKNDPLWFMNTDEYFTSAFDFLLQKLPDIGNFSTLAFEYFTEVIVEIERNLQLILEGHDNYSFYDALTSTTIGEIVPIFRQFASEKRKPKNLDSILIAAAFVRQTEEFLATFNDQKAHYVVSPKKYVEFRKGLKGKYQYWANLDRIKIRVDKLQKEKIDTAIKNFINIKGLISALQQDASFAAMIFGGYEMWLYDLYRGK